jgi:hypothetical protein
MLASKDRAYDDGIDGGVLAVAERFPTHPHQVLPVERTAGISVPDIVESGI